LIAAVLGVGLLAYGTWCCLDWMVRREIVRASLWASETWPDILSLSSEQRSKIMPLEKAFRNSMGPLQAELAQSEMALCRLLMALKPERKAMSRALGRVTELQRLREERVLDHLLALRRVLSPEQQRRLFTTLMKDLCRGCRAATGSKKDFCGFCQGAG